MSNYDSKNEILGVGNANSAGWAFSLGASLAVATSLIFSLIIAIMGVIVKQPVSTLVSNDFIIILSYLMGTLACGTTLVVYSAKYKPNFKGLLKFDKKVNNLVIYIATLLITFGVMFGLAELNQYFLTFLQSLGVEPSTPTLPVKNPITVILTIITVCLLPAVFEECLFRGIITFSLEGAGETFAIIASGALFSLFHMQPAQTIYQFVFGCLFAFIALRAQSVLPVIISHFINNLFVVLNYYFFGLEIVGGAKTALTICALVALAVGVALIIIFTKKSENSQEKLEKTPFKSFMKSGLLGLVVAVAMWLTNLV